MKKIFVSLLFLNILFTPIFSNNLKIQLGVTIPVETKLSSCNVEKASNIWVEMIKNAKESIDFGEFYITQKDGEILDNILNELKKAGERGVKIRFLTDKKMLNNSKNSLEKLKQIKNLKITVFDWSKLTKGVLHAKYFVVDRKSVYIGSQNFDWRSLTHIHETGIKVENEEFAKSLQAIFNADWNYNNGDSKAYEKLRKMKFNFSKNLYLTGSPKKYLPQGVNYSLNTILNAIDNSKSKITVQLLNFSTKIYNSKNKFLKLSNALKNAAKRGVKVKLLVSNWNKRKPGVYDLMNLVKEKNIEVKFANIPVASSGFVPYARVIHSKVMRVDDEICMIGTSNWAEGYFTSSRNLEVFVQDKKVAEKLDCLFNSIWNSTYVETVVPGKKYKSPKIY